MQEHDAEQTETTEDSGEAAAAQDDSQGGSETVAAGDDSQGGGETVAAGDDSQEGGETVAAGDDSQVVDSVDQRAAELTGSGGASADAPQAGGDAITQAENHLADVDMDAQRAQLKELQKDM